MLQPVCDCFFLNIEYAYRAAEAGQTVVGADGRERLQYCYYDGPLTDITLPHFIQVSSERFVEFFSHNQLPIPDKIAISQDGGVQFGDMPADVVDEIRGYRATYKPAESVHFDTYFIDPLLALNVAKQRNRVACGHPTIDGLQICYYRGDLPAHDLDNLIHMELEQYEDFFIRSRLRMPEDIQIPDGLEADVQNAVRQDIANAVESIKQRRSTLIQQLLNKAKAMRPGPIGARPRIFIPSSRLTTVMQYSSKGIAKAFADLGWEVRFYIQNNEMEGSNMVDMLEQYIDFDPHACFYVNSLNNSFMHADVVNVIWWQDLMPQFKERQPLRWRKRDFNFSISPLFERYLADCAAERVERLHFVIDDEVFHNRIAGERAERAVFVGSSYLPVVNFDDAQHRQALDALVAVMERGGTFDEATVAGIAGAAGLSYEFVFWKLLHYAVRDHALHWLCEADVRLPVDVYGRYWDRDERIAPYYHGELAHGEPVAEVYRNARYALVCHPFEINSQRLAEVAACGCIPLVYDCRDVAEPPHWDEHCLFFKTAAELKQILKQRLWPAKAPEELAAQFTYRAAAQRISEIAGLDRLLASEGRSAPSAGPVLQELCGERLKLVCDNEETRQVSLNRLQANLAALAQYRPELHRFLLQSWPELQATITLDRPIGDEYWRVTVSIGGEAAYHLDKIGWLEHRRMIADNAKMMIRENTCCYALAGIGAGYELMAAYQATERPIPEMAEFEVPVYLVESRPEMWLLNLLLHDLTLLLAARRLQIYHGNDAAERLDAEFARFEAALPDVLFNLDPVTVLGANAIYQRVIDAKQNRAERHAENLQQVAEYYAAIGTDAWREKFREERRGELRVMGFISRYSSFLKYCMRDWLDGFERLGATIHLCSESENYYLSTIEHLIDDINYFKPDLILAIDHFRHEFDGIPKSIPFVNWIQDMLPSIVENNVALGARDFTYVFVKEWLHLNKLEIYRAQPVEFLPIGYNDKVYFPISEKKKYTCDVLVITHLQDPEKTFDPIRNPGIFQFRLNSNESKLIDACVIKKTELVELYGKLEKHLSTLDINEFNKFCTIRHMSDGDTRAEFSELFNESHPGLPPLVMEVLFPAVGNRLHCEYLNKMKAWAVSVLIDSRSDVSINLYGINWDRYSKFKCFSRGVADNGEHINRIMNGSKICLNVSPGVSLHMRAMEIMASCSFMLTPRNEFDGSRLSDYFSDEQIVMYQDENDFLEKIKFYLNHDEERNRVSKNALNRLQQIFSYEAVAERILKSINNGFVQ